MLCSGLGLRIQTIILIFQSIRSYLYNIKLFGNFFSDSLRGYFGKFGEIADSVIMKDKHTNEPRYMIKKLLILSGFTKGL